MKQDKTFRVAVGSWAGRNMGKGPCPEEIAKNLGYERDKKTGYFAANDLTKSALMDLASQILDLGASVMIRPTSNDDSSLDYVVFIDTKNGRFSQR